MLLLVLALAQTRKRGLASFYCRHFACSVCRHMRTYARCIPTYYPPATRQLKSPVYDDLISPLKAVTEQPFWIPSQSLQLKMVTHAHTLIEVLNQVGLHGLWMVEV